MLGFANACLHHPIIGQNHQSFRVGIKTSGRINARYIDKVSKGPTVFVRSELGKYPVRLVKQDYLTQLVYRLKNLIA